MKKPREKPLSYAEKRELAELWQKAAEAARAEGKSVAPQWVTDVGQRAALNELRERFG